MSDVEIVDYRDELQPYFYSINAEWISNMFTMEDIDKEVLLNPHKYILSNVPHH